MPRANQINDHMAAQIKAMKNRGDKNQDIAAWFGINSGRISEICGDNPKPAYRHIRPERHDIPPPGPYEFGGGGIVQLYRTIVEIKELWDKGNLRSARLKFDSIYRSMGRQDPAHGLPEELVSEFFYDERGCPKP